MNDIALYGFPVSAFVAKARIALDFKGLRYSEAPPPDGYGSPAYRAIIPAGSAPGMVIDGRPLHDSNAIPEMLEEIAPEPALFPADPYERALTRALLGFHDTRLEPAARALFPLVKDRALAAGPALDEGFANISAALERLAGLVAPSPFHLGKTATMADMAYPVTLQMIEMLAQEFGREAGVPAPLQRWREASGEIPAVARSLTIAGAAMESWLAGFR